MAATIIDLQAARETRRTRTTKRDIDARLAKTIDHALDSTCAANEAVTCADLDAEPQVTLPVAVVDALIASNRALSAIRAALAAARIDRKFPSAPADLRAILTTPHAYAADLAEAWLGRGGGIVTVTAAR